MQAKQKETLLHGSIWKSICLFALPIYFSVLFLQAYSWIDSYFLGLDKSSIAFSTIALAGNVIYFGTTYSSGFATGASAFTSKLYGEGKVDETRKAFAQTLVLLLVDSLFISVLMVGITNFLVTLVNCPNEEIRNSLIQYLYIIFGAGLLGIHLQSWMVSFFRSIDMNKESFFVMAFYSLVNIFLDFLFIYVWKMGASGVAIAYVLSQFLSAIFGFVLLAIKAPQYLPKKQDWFPQKSLVLSTSKSALPFALQSAIVGIGLFLLQRSLNSFGTSAINGYSVACKLFNLMALFNAAISSSLLVFTSQNFGANNKERIKKGILSSTLIVFLYSLIAFAVLFFSKDSISYLFLSGDNAKNATSFCATTLVIYSFSFFINGVLNLVRNALFGIQKPLFSFVSCVAESLVRILFALCFTSSMGFIGVPYSDLTSWSIGLLICLIGLIIFWKKKDLTNETKLVQ
jgi:Na+-driven multidrug efflux pump